MVLHHVIGKENALEPAVHHQDKQAKQAQAIVKISTLKQAHAQVGERRLQHLEVPSASLLRFPSHASASHP